MIELIILLLNLLLCFMNYASVFRSYDGVFHDVIVLSVQRKLQLQVDELHCYHTRSFFSVLHESLCNRQTVIDNGFLIHVIIFF